MVRRQDVPALKAAQALAPEIIEYVLENDLSELEDCRKRGLRNMLAYMGRNRDMFARIADLRPDIVNLHFPFLFRDFLKDHFSD